MIAHFAKKISHFFIKKEVIRQDDYEVYSYSLELLISTLINFVMIISIAIISRKVPETIFYIAAFIPLRISAGGYHANTHARCLLILLISYIVFLIVISCVSINLSIIISLVSLGLAILIIYIYAPVEDINNPMNKEQKRKQIIKSRVTISFISTIALLLLLFDSYLSLSLSLGCISVALAIVASKVKFHIRVNTTY